MNLPGITIQKTSARKIHEGQLSPGAPPPSGVVAWAIAFVLFFAVVAWALN